jgi:hypothetical protein
MRPTRRMGLVAAFALATLAHAAGDPGTATIASDRFAVTFPEGCLVDGEFLDSTSDQSVAIADGALVVTGTTAGTEGWTDLEVPGSQDGPFTADVVVDLTAARTRTDSTAPRVTFGIAYDSYQLYSDIVVVPTASGVSVRVEGAEGRIAGPFAFASAVLALHAERHATGVRLSAGPVGSAATPLAETTFDFANSPKSAVDFEIEGLTTDDAVVVDDFLAAGALHRETRPILDALRGVVAVLRSARAADAATAKQTLAAAASTLRKQARRAVVLKRHPPFSLRPVLRRGTTQANLARQAVVQARRLAALGADFVPAVDAALVATLAAGHLFRGMSSAEPWDQP